MIRKSLQKCPELDAMEIKRRLVPSAALPVPPPHREPRGMSPIPDSHNFARPGVRAKYTKGKNSYPGGGH
jgi:hypothetical protein